jgi:hypothetical protein
MISITLPEGLSGHEMKRIGALPIRFFHASATSKTV